MVSYAETSFQEKFILIILEKNLIQKMERVQIWMIMRFPKTKREAGKELKILIQIILDTKEKYKSKEIVKTLTGVKNALIISHRTHEAFFGVGEDMDAKF